MRSQRQLKVGEELRHILSTVFMRGEVPWPIGSGSPTITVTEVQVSPDLKNATVFVMPLGGQNKKEIVKYLNSIVGFFRHAVAQNTSLRYTPRLRFTGDESFDYAQKIDTILHEPSVAKDLKKSKEDDDTQED
jgi:ribosome-binding factor A